MHQQQFPGVSRCRAAAVVALLLHYRRRETSVLKACRIWPAITTGSW